MRACKLTALALLGLALLWSAPASSAPSIGTADGWHKWQVEGGMMESSSCCYRHTDKSPGRGTCDLDGRHGIVISSSPCVSDSGITVFYVRKENGRPTRIRVFDSSCDVSTDEEITDLGTLTQDDSVTMLIDIVSRKELGKKVREEALFWLAQSNSDTAYEYFDRLLFAQKK